MFYVYFLQSSTNKDLYIGFCRNLKSRFNDHNEGRVRSTKPYKPWILVYYEAYKNIKDATKREKQLKNHRAKEDLKLQLSNSLL